MEDVAGEDHAALRARHEHERGQAVVADRAFVREARSTPPANSERRCRRAERRAEADAVGEHETRERRRPDRVGEEREARAGRRSCRRARRRPRAEQLHEPSLDERVAERLEHSWSTLRVLPLVSFVKRNLRFVISVAKKYQNRGLPLIDLIGEGNVGLLTAARKFDPDQGVKFISYAVWWIRQAILSALARQGRTVRVPLNRTADLSRIIKA